jgi:hypothetical protein
VKSISGRNPVFVDSTGRRHRTIRRAGAFLAVPATAYVVLLVSSLLGGPTVNTPLVPLPAAPERLSEPRPVVTPTPVSAGESTTSPETAGPSEKTPTQDPTQLPTPILVTPVTAPVTPGMPTSPTGNPTGTPTATPTGTPTGTPTVTPTGTPTGTPTPTSTPGQGQGKPATPPGHTKTPNKP